MRARAYAFLHTGFDACRRAVIARGQHALILDDNRTDASSVAAGPGSNELSHLHKAMIPFVKHVGFLRSEQAHAGHTLAGVI